MIGAGVIGVEYATIFSALDVPVTLIEPRNTILDFIDREIVDEFIHQLRDRGMTIRLGSAVKEIDVDGRTAPRSTLADGRVVRSEMLLYAAGRTGNVGSLGLDAVGIEADARGRIKVDPQTFQTSVPQHLCRRRRHRLPEPRLDLDGAGPGRRLPRLRRRRCRRRRSPFPMASMRCRRSRRSACPRRRCARAAMPYECGIARFRETSRGHIMGVNSGLLKLIFSLETRRLLGAHIVGEGATELIHIGQAVINLGGTVDYFVENTFNYPTLAEAYKIAGLDAWNRMGAG